MNTFVEVQDLFRVVLKRWWLLLPAVIIGVGLGYGATIRQTPYYAATTTLFVGRSIQANDLSRTDLQTGTQLAATYAEIVRRQPVLQGTVAALQLNMGWQSLRSLVRVAQVEETQLLEIRVEAEAPRLAEQIADEVAQQLIALSPSATNQFVAEDSLHFIRQRLRNIELQSDRVQQELEAVQAELVTLPSSQRIEASVLQTEAEALEKRLLEWDTLYARLLGLVNDARATNQITVVEPAQASTSPVRPQLELNLAVGLLVALVLGLFLIFLLEYWGDKMRTTDDIVAQIGLPMLGTLRQVAGRREPDRLIHKQPPTLASTEDYRLLRSKLQFSTDNFAQKTLLITSTAASEGKSLVTANLGIAIAEAGFSVIIVDANLRQPMQHRIFGLSNNDGLLELLHGPKHQWQQYLQATTLPNLCVLTTGTLEVPSPGILGSLQMKLVLDVLAEQADVLLFDTPQATNFADAALFAHQASGVILVMREGKMQRKAIQDVVQNLQATGAQFVGAVVNQPKVRATIGRIRNTPNKSPFTLSLPGPQKVDVA